MTVIGGGQSYHVPGGVCGFASVVIKPGTSKFARWLSKGDLASKSCFGGVVISARVGGQSLGIKEAWASAFAASLNANGIDAYMTSRMD